MRIIEITWRFEQLLKNLPSSLLNQKASTSQWSVAEIIDHLKQINEPLPQLPHDN